MYLIYLRKGKVIQFEDKNLFVGVLNLAKNLELNELVKLLDGFKISKMSAESIVSLNVGGTIFQTSPSTMLKYPDSKLARMYNEGQKIKDLNFFFDEDPEYFRIVLNFLRKGKLIQYDEKNLFVGVRDLAKNLELDELVKLLEFGNSQLVLEIGQIGQIGQIGDGDWSDYSSDYSSDYQEITIARKFLTRVPDSHLAKFFSGEQGCTKKKKKSQNPLSNSIFKKGPNRYSINRRTDLTEHLLKFMKMPANSDFKTYGNVKLDAFSVPTGQTSFSSIHFVEELFFYGIQEFDHYKKSPNRNPNIEIEEYPRYGQNIPPQDLSSRYISWNENYNVN
jgi:hypothetical protein